MLSRKNMSKLSPALMLVVATLAFTFWGYFWYATLFDDLWQSLIGKTEGELILMAEKRGATQSILTYVISFIQVLGLYIVHTLTKSKTFIGFQLKALVVSLFIVTPALGNAVLFAGASETLWIFDSLHFLFGYAGISLIFWIWSQFFSPNHEAGRAVAA